MNGDPDRTKASRIIKRLQADRLVAVRRKPWALTEAGKTEAKKLRSSQS
jgi:Mn-dependent DtxR family transcriptional regulator